MTRPLRLLAAGIVLVAVATCRSAAGDPSARLESITLRPREAHRSVGEVERFTVIGHYAGGTTQNLTQRVVYASSDPAVARPANVKGDRSRIDAVAAGTVTISVTDPRTGIGSHASGGDATLTVLGALESISLTPSMLTRTLGQTQRLTATGHYAGGATRNLTQRLVYRSSNPAVAAAPNAEGDKSRIEIVGTGTAVISAVDPKTGVSSSDAAGDASLMVVPTKP
jgi:trimeric autotransporter adhesin